MQWRLASRCRSFLPPRHWLLRPPRWTAAPRGPPVTRASWKPAPGQCGRPHAAPELVCVANVAEQMASCLQGQVLRRAQLPLGSLGSCSGGDGCLVSRQCPLETATWPPGDSRGGGSLQSSPQLEPRETPEPHVPSSVALDACPSGVVRERLLSQDARFWGAACYTATEIKETHSALQPPGLRGTPGTVSSVS